MTGFLSLKGQFQAISGGLEGDVDPAYKVKLHTGNPGPEGKNNVAAENTQKTVRAASTGTGQYAINTETLEWVAVKATEAYTHFSIWDPTTGTIFWGYGVLDKPYEVEKGDTFKIEPEEIQIEVEKE